MSHTEQTIYNTLWMLLEEYDPEKGFEDISEKVEVLSMYASEQISKEHSIASTK